MAYESQLKSDRAELHRRVAAAIESRDPATADDDAALMAEHLEAAGDLHTAYGWQMRAATWAINRDIAAARLSWERASKIADGLPTEDPDRLAMRIAPRTLLCGFGWLVHINVAGARFDELRQLCAAAAYKASLAIGMAGLLADHIYRGRMPEASPLASEAMALIESVGDPTLTVGLSFAPIRAIPGSAFANLFELSDPGEPRRTLTMPSAQWFSEQIGALGWATIAAWWSMTGARTCGRRGCGGCCGCSGSTRPPCSTAAGPPGRRGAIGSGRCRVATRR